MKQTRIVQTRNMTPYSRKNNNQTTANHARQNTNLDKIALLTILAEFAFCLAGHLSTAILADTIYISHLKITPETQCHQRQKR